jgi:hypothetical protein
MPSANKTPPHEKQSMSNLIFSFTRLQHSSRCASCCATVAGPSRPHHRGGISLKPSGHSASPMSLAMGSFQSSSAGRQASSLEI